MKSLTATIENQVDFTADSAIVQRWIKFAQVAETSEKAYRKGIKNFANFLKSVGINSPADVSRETIIDYRAYLGSKYKSPSTKNLYLTATKLFFKFLYVEGFIGNDPALHVKGFKTSASHRKDAITPAQNKQIIKSLEDSVAPGKRQSVTALRNLAMYAVMAFCGLRCVEVSRARVSDFKVEENGNARLFVEGKGHCAADEYVWIPASVVTLIENYLAARGTVEVNAPLFASRKKGGALLPTTISAIVKKLFRANQINSSTITAHSLRHGFATVALAGGATLRQVQLALRHTSINVTTRYLHEMEKAINPASNIASAACGCF